MFSINNIDYKIAPVNYILSVDSSVEPITLDYVKDYLRISSTDDDTLLGDLITTARNYGEKYIGRDFINKTYVCYLDCFPNSFHSIELRKSKLQSISSIEYYKDDVLTDVDSSIYYFTDESEYSTINLKTTESWPRDADDRKQTVKITFVSGYGATSADVPQGIKSAMLAHIANMYENRGDCMDCDTAFKNSKSSSLYAPYRLNKTMFEAISGLW